jgi:hypothetical protein
MTKVIAGKAALAALSLAALALAAPASAQTAMRANIPFAFVAGDQLLPAGAYNFVIDPGFSLCRIDSVSDGSMHPIRFVPGASRRQGANADAGVVQFQKYGDRYFLSGVWRPGNPDGLAAVTNHRLIESAKSQGVGETVSVDSELK